MKYPLEEFFDAIAAFTGEEDDHFTKSEFLHLVVDTLDWMGEPECVSCGTDTNASGEYFMVHDDIWDKYGVPGEHRRLCIGCLEVRMGRELTSEDFPNAPINSGEPLSDRLKDRLRPKR